MNGSEDPNRSRVCRAEVRGGRKRGPGAGRGKTLERLRAYRESDPDFKAAYADFVEAEMTYDDPLEGEPYEIENPVRSKVQSLLTDA